MIKNVIFDFGNVLVSFDPTYMTGRYISEPVQLKLAADVIFDRLYWDRLDAGTVSDEEVVSDIKRRLPLELHEQAERVYYDWIYNIPEIEGMRQIVLKLKEHKINIALLSNISTYFAAHWHEIPLSQIIENTVFSSVCGFAKPNEEIYKYTLERFGFNPDETLFVDDRMDNIEGAEKVGIHGFCFKGKSEELMKFLKENVLTEEK